MSAAGERHFRKCDQCGKEVAAGEAMFGYGKALCSKACFDLAGKDYEPGKAGGSPLSCRGGKGRPARR